MADLKAKQIKFPLTGTSIVSSSAQIATDISGSFTPASASFSTRVTTAETELGNTLFSSSAQVDHDSTTNFVANEHIDHSGVTLTAGDGLSGGGDITTNRSFAVGAAQTTITSIINSSLGKIGTAADQEYITFGTSNEVNTFVNNSERLSVTNTGVDITGNLDTSATGSFGHISSTGVIRTTSIISGSTLEATGDLTLDASGDIILDADGTDVILKDGGTSFGSFKRVSSDFIIKAETADKDIVFKGTDASTTITALTLDMSEGGNAQFLGNISGSQIEASGDVIAFGSSDRRLKDNITPISEPLNKLSKVGGYTFIWNDKQDAYKGKDVGVIAQEIEEILPEVVTTRGTGYKAVKYEKIVPLLIESIKELQKKVQEIEQNCDCLNK